MKSLYKPVEVVSQIYPDTVIISLRDTPPVTIKNWLEPFPPEGAACYNEPDPLPQTRKVGLDRETHSPKAIF